MDRIPSIPLVRSRIEPEGLTLMQPRKGFRFGPENLLLTDILGQTANHDEAPCRVIVDLGAGCGVLGLLALRKLSAGSRRPQLVAVERNADLASAADASIRQLPIDLQARAHLIKTDLRCPCEALPSADLVLCNPPFFPPGHGRPSANPAVHEATHALHGGLPEFLETAAGILQPHGTICLLMPADMLAEVCSVASRLALHLRWCFVLDARHIGRPYRTWLVLRKTPGPAIFRHLSVTSIRSR